MDTLRVVIPVISENEERHAHRHTTRQLVKMLRRPRGAEIAFVFEAMAFRMSVLSEKLNSDLKGNFELSHSCG